MNLIESASGTSASGGVVCMLVVGEVALSSEVSV